MNTNLKRQSLLVILHGDENTEHKFKETIIVSDSAVIAVLKCIRFKVAFQLCFGVDLAYFCNIY